jgi:uncharacterized protein YjgD (DUF1641 family)
MAKYLDFKYRAESPEELLHKQLDVASIEHAQALLKAYALLDAAEKRGVLDLLRGAINAEDAIIDKVAGYANTPQAINGIRNLMILGKFLGSIDPDVLGDFVNRFSTSVVAESKKQPSGVFAMSLRLLNGDALRGLGLTLAALESLGRTARSQERK